MTAKAIGAEIEALERLDLPALRADWRSRWGEPPKLRSRELLAHALAHRIQVEVYGDLAPATRRRLGDLGRRFAADRDYRPVAGPSLTIGCTLVREWGAKRHEVKVVEGGFGYRGATFASLSAVAQHITGTKRSGVLFFGLKASGA